MANYEHLPIYKDSFDFVIMVEKQVGLMGLYMERIEFG
jgi:hypothetical protein